MRILILILIKTFIIWFFNPISYAYPLVCNPSTHST